MFRINIRAILTMIDNINITSLLSEIYLLLFTEKVYLKKNE